jgi:phosphatidylglycerophosphate synthase
MKRQMDAPTPSHGAGPASIRRFYEAASANRAGGDLFSTHISDRLASWVAALAMRCGAHPTVITLANLVVTVGASMVVIIWAERATSFWAAGWLVLIAWQVGYVLDCADGQVARATMKKSSFGARVDVLVDYAAQTSIVCAVAAVLLEFSDPPPALVALFAAVWFESLIIGIMARNDGNRRHSFVTRGGVVDVVKLARAAPFVFLVFGAWLLVSPASVIIPVVALAGFNSLFVLASIGREAWLSMARA